MAEIGLSAHPIGFRSIEELTQSFKRIRTDEREIRKALDRIKALSWENEFASRHGVGIRIPASLAEELCPVVKLQYFDPWVVKLLLMHVILKRMYAENAENPAARKLMPDPQEKQFAILKAKGNDQVEGLADIELLSYCDLSEQTVNQSPQIIMALTFDKGLRSALRMRSASRRQATGRGGSEDAENSGKRVAFMLYHSTKRTAKANRRTEEYIQDLQGFLKLYEKYLPMEMADA